MGISIQSNPNKIKIYLPGPEFNAALLCTGSSFLTGAASYFGSSFAGYAGAAPSGTIVKRLWPTKQTASSSYLIS